MRTARMTPQPATNDAQQSVECLSVDAFYDTLQEGEEMDELRSRVERVRTFRDAYNDQE